MRCSSLIRITRRKKLSRKLKIASRHTSFNSSFLTRLNFTLFNEKSGRQDLNLSPKNHNDLSNHNLQENQKAALAKNCPQDKTCPDLQQIISAWPNLPEHIKQAIKALVNTHNKETKL